MRGSNGGSRQRGSVFNVRTGAGRRRRRWAVQVDGRRCTVPDGGTGLLEPLGREGGSGVSTKAGKWSSVVNFAAQQAGGQAKVGHRGTGGSRTGLLVWRHERC